MSDKIDKQTLIKYIDEMISEIQSGIQSGEHVARGLEYEYRMGKIVALQYLKYDIEAGRVDG